MQSLLDAAARPMLTNVTLHGLNHPEQYPLRIPDLCIGQPVLVSGSVTQQGPVMADVHGQLTGLPGEGLGG